MSQLLYLYTMTVAALTSQRCCAGIGNVSQGRPLPPPPSEVNPGTTFNLSGLYPYLPGSKPPAYLLPYQTLQFSLDSSMPSSDCSQAGYVEKCANLGLSWTTITIVAYTNAPSQIASQCACVRAYHTPSTSCSAHQLGMVPERCHVMCLLHNEGLGSAWRVCHEYE